MQFRRHTADEHTALAQSPKDCLRFAAVCTHPAAEIRTVWRFHVRGVHHHAEHQAICIVLEALRELMASWCEL